jgi:hypothetical protein
MVRWLTATILEDVVEFERKVLKGGQASSRGSDEEAEQSGEDGEKPVPIRRVSGVPDMLLNPYRSTPFSEQRTKQHRSISCGSEQRRRLTPYLLPEYPTPPLALYAPIFYPN